MRRVEWYFRNDFQPYAIHGNRGGVYACYLKVLVRAFRPIGKGGHVYSLGGREGECPVLSGSFLTAALFVLCAQCWA